MQTSTFLKIGIIGTTLSVIAGFIPFVSALLGNSSVTTQLIHRYINEDNLLVALFIFATMIVYAVVKKSSESKEQQQSG